MINNTNNTDTNTSQIQDQQAFKENIISNKTNSIINPLQKLLNENITACIDCQYYNEEQLNNIQHNKSKLNIFHMNIRSLNANRFELQKLLSESKITFDVIALTEIGNTNIQENLNTFVGYEKFCHNSKTRCGGTALLIKDNISITRERIDLKLNEDENYQVEDTWIEFTSPSLKKPVIIGVIYKHPSKNLHAFNSEIEKTLQLINKENKFCFICGDINIDLLQSNQGHPKDFLNTMLSENFIPHITCPTRITNHSATLIDNIFIHHTPQTIEEKIISGNIVTDITDHFPNFIIIGQEEIKDNHDFKEIRIYNENSIKEFMLHLHKEENWREFYKKTSCDAATAEYIRITQEAFEKYFPKKKVKLRKHNDKRWITSGIKNSCKKKHKLYLKYMKHPSEENENNWKTYRRVLKTVCRKAECLYFRELIGNAKGSLKKLWDAFRPILNTNKQKQQKIDKIIVNGNVINDSKSIANSFNDYFCEIGNVLSQKIPTMSISYKHYLQNSNLNSIFVNPITEQEVIQEISKLGERRAIGIYDIPVKLMKTSKELLSKPLSKIFNMSIEQGMFPNMLKIARITPIYKNSEKEHLQNYRPISILCSISKIFEKIMYKQLYSFLEKYKLLYEKQFGFRRKHSTVHALIEVTKKIRYALDNDALVMGIYLDVKKAFDTVNHVILLEKLYHYGVRGNIHKWFKSYLTNRMQFVQVDGINSNYQNIKSGVPQGSVLGPLLFLIYVNDVQYSIQKISDSQVMLFADDTNILLFANNEKQIMKMSKNCIDQLYIWFCCNKLTLNITKTNYCLFHKSNRNISSYCDTINVGNDCIYRVSNVRYLGMIIDDKLEWKIHIENIVKKLVKISSTFKFLRNYIPHKCKKQLYYAYAYSTITYGIQVYGITKDYNINKIQLLQNRILKTLFNKDWYINTNLLHRELQILKVADIVKLFVLKFVHNCKTGCAPDIFQTYYIPRYNIHTKNTRYCDNFELPICNTSTYGQASIRYIGAKMYNGLPNSIKDTGNCKKFNNIVKIMLLEYYQ